MKKLLQLLFISLIATSAFGQGKIGYLSFVTGGTSAANNLNPQDNPIEANYKMTDLTNMTLSRGSGMVYANNSTYSYVGYLPGGGTKADAIANNVYYELKLNSNTKNMYLSSLTAILRTANAYTAADVSYRWYYKIGAAGTFTEIGTADVLLGLTNGNGDLEPALDLSSIPDLQYIQPNTDIYFRLYAWGAKAKEIDGTTDVALTTRGFGFGKSSATTTELITVKGFLTEAPLMAAWDFTGINASTYATATVATVFQQPWARKSTTTTPIDVARGNGLEKGSLGNAYAVIYKDQVGANIPTDLASAITKETYYGVELVGDATNYTQILGYKMKMRGGTTTATNARWQLLIGDASNLISASSPVITLGSADVNIASASDGLYYTLALNNNDISAVIPPNKKAELRLYVWGGTSTVGVFGLGRLPDENHLQLYGKTLTPAEYLQILPVHLTAFKATKQGAAAVLNWTTASETNNSHFEILRAGEDKKWVNIGRVKGNENSSSAQQYAFTDFNPLAGTNYYTLRQVDLDGKQEDVAVGFVQFGLTEASVKILSTAEAVKALVYANETSKSEVSIYAISGNAVLKKQAVLLNPGYNELNLPVSLSKGVYIIMIDSPSGQKIRTKFIK